jgi:XTP/dITP diphosphohydrolase
VLWLPEGEVFVTSGVLNGRIAAASRGSGGFGYDPLFVPEGETRTLAEISTGEKNLTSHRAKSMARMMRVLDSLLKDGALAAP